MFKKIKLHLFILFRIVYYTLKVSVNWTFDSSVGIYIVPETIPLLYSRHFLKNNLCDRLILRYIQKESTTKNFSCKLWDEWIEQKPKDKFLQVTWKKFSDHKEILGTCLLYIFRLLTKNIFRKWTENKYQNSNFSDRCYQRTNVYKSNTPTSYRLNI